MARYHIYKLGLAIVFYMICLKTKLLVSGLKDDEIAPMLRTTDYRERRDAGDFKGDGTPNVDFPTYSHVPKTKFSCKDMEPGYYADIDTDCQVFHICDEGRKLSFLCPNGTVFQQGELICDWWFKVNCTTAPLLYEESAEILQRENARRKSHRRTNTDSKHSSSSQEDYSSRQVPSTTESFPRKFTSRSDRRQDSITYEPISNKIDEPRQHDHAQNTNKFQRNQNHLEELGIIIKANNNLPLSTNRPINNKSRISSYGNSIKDISIETQEVQETASFVTNSRNHLPTYTKTYPNHRETYSDIQDPRHYYQQHTKLPAKPFYGSSVSPQVLSTVPVSSSFSNFLLTTEPSQPTFESRFSFNFKTNAPVKKRTESIKTLYTTTVATTTNTNNNFYDNHRTTTETQKLETIEVDSRLLQSDTVTEKPVDATTTEQPTSTTTTITSTTTNKPTETTITKLQTTTYLSTTDTPTTTVYSTPVTTTAPRFFPSTVLQPKPFSLNPNTVLPTQSTTPSLKPFIINVNPPDPLELSFPIPTQPTPFNLPTTTISPVEENVNNMIETLMNVVSRKLNTEGNSTAPSPELLSPPSVGPQTLHTLAIYFANALENMSSNGSEESTTAASLSNNEEVIKDLLTQMTRNNYDNLFKQTTEASTQSIDDVDVANDLVKENTHNLVSDVPNVRVLARVFTEALSAYLEDPETFKKVLHEVRPTEPPSLPNETTETDEDEVLNYSDSDLKADLPYLHTPTTDSSISPTWGYILALNTTSPTDLSKNLLSPESENLLSADSQSFVSQFNKIMQEMKATATPEEANALSALPKNHWTMSKDVEKLWQNALSINPLAFNENFDTANLDTSIGSEDTSDESLVSEVHYDLRSLPKVELNSTQVHGILIDFMQSNKTQGAEKLQRLLNKLNITENQFLTRMKEVEKNPFTRRLILLLINECSNSNSKEEVEPRALSAIDDLEEKENATHTQSEDTLFKNIDPKLQEEDEDTRALRLLNSLYVIASKFGK
ncbi:hypothetical protein FQR65_LT09666 [Abscondita terminalis]|nr:hypothetical protein FQR65_LT09666 [Abscondita terminalis]